MIELFQLGDFVLAGGARSGWKIECDAFTPAEWRCLAVMAAERLPPFGSVHGVPYGGLPFAEALRRHAVLGHDTVLVAEDVVTTGGSVERYVKELREGSRAAPSTTYVGVCVFARGKCPPWVYPLFQMGEAFRP
jgi:orotate phosphoribosyltransferase